MNSGINAKKSEESRDVEKGIGILTEGQILQDSLEQDGSARCWKASSTEEKAGKKL
jgi:hypothetical protein